MDRSSPLTISLARPAALVVLITLLGFSARFINLGSDSVWADEMFVFGYSRQDVDQIISGQDVNYPPGFLLALHFSLKVWGTSEYALRLVSALAGVVTIPLIYVAGSLIANRRVGLWAAALIAVAPFHIRYSQEATSYATLVMLTVASTACLFLSLREQGRRWWIGFGIATALSLYAHYGTIVVLACQITFVGLLALARLLLKRWSIRQALEITIGLAIGIVLAGALYGPWIGQTGQGVSANIGSGQTWLARWANVPPGDWISAGYFAFGFMNPVLAGMMGALSIIGIVGGAIRRQIGQVLWLVVGLALPIGLITLTGISRAPLPKYILFMLPVYLIAAAIGLDEIIGRVEARIRSVSYLVPAMAATSLLAIAIPLVLAEHAYIYEDWRGIVQYLKGTAQDGDVLVPITLDLPDGFNQGVVNLSYYLPRELPNVRLLIGEHLADSTSDLAAVAQSSGEVWFTLLNRIQPVRFDDPGIEVKPFQSALYLVRSTASEQPPLEEMIQIYDKIIPQAMAPAPRCYLWFDLATVQIQLGRYDDARRSVSSFEKPCPGTLTTRQTIYRLLLDHYLEVDDLDQAHTAALELLALDAKDKQALDTLTVYDLTALFKAGQAEVIESPVLPIQQARFTMPQSGDWGDVLLMQAPARLIYHLTLPSEPSEFQARIAMAPESWEWGGDGVTFIVRVTNDKDEQIAFQQHVSNSEVDRRWLDVRVPLSPYAGQTVTLTLETDPGPVGDTMGDWAGWDTPGIFFVPVNSEENG